MSSTLNIGNLINQGFFSIDSEPEWLQQIRKSAWKRFKELPYESDPNMLNFLQPKKLENLEISIPNSSFSEQIKNSEITSFDDSIHLLCSPESLGTNFPTKLAEANKSVIFKSLNDAINSDDSFKSTFISLINLPITDKLIALLSSSFEWGSYTIIKDGTTINEPIKFSFDNNEQNQSKTGIHIIKIGDNVNITLDINYISQELLYDHSVTYLVLGSNSHVNILIKETGHSERKTNRGFISKIGKDSSINFAQIQVDGTYIRQRSEFYFTEVGGDLVEIVCLRGHKNQEYDFYSGIYHATPNCTSNTIARGVNDDESMTIFKGKVEIGKDGAKVNTNLSLRGLLLSKKARFHALPAMEVINNNVVATHGAAVSKIDPEQIFYFQTRGISKEDAEYMIASGYFEPAITKIRSNFLQESAREIINKAVNEQFLT